MGTADGVVGLYEVGRRVKSIWRTVVMPSLVPLEYVFRGTDIFVLGAERGEM